jgi:hypothetical protein
MPGIISVRTSGGAGRRARRRERRRGEASVEQPGIDTAKGASPSKYPGLADWWQHAGTSGEGTDDDGSDGGTQIVWGSEMSGEFDDFSQLLGHHDRMLSCQPTYCRLTTTLARQPLLHPRIHPGR